MFTKGLVSICIPASNAALTIQTAIQSALNQTYLLIEVLVCVNTSTDDTLAKCQQINNPNLKIITSDKTGIANARNSLISESKGEFIAWLDADDIAMPNRIMEQVAYLNLHPTINVLGTYAKVRGSNTIKEVKMPLKNGYLKAWLLLRNPFVQSSLMIRSNCNPNYDPLYDYVEDYAWFVKHINNLEFAVIPIIACSYYINVQAIKNKQKTYTMQSKLVQILQMHTCVKKEDLANWENLMAFARGEIGYAKPVFLFLKELYSNKNLEEYTPVFALQLARFAMLYPKIHTVVYVLLRPKIWFLSRLMRMHYTRL